MERLQRSQPAADFRAGAFRHLLPPGRGEGSAAVLQRIFPIIGGLVLGVPVHLYGIRTFFLQGDYPLPEIAVDSPVGLRVDDGEDVSGGFAERFLEFFLHLPAYSLKFADILLREGLLLVYPEPGLLGAEAFRKVPVREFAHAAFEVVAFAFLHPVQGAV